MGLIWITVKIVSKNEDPTRLSNGVTEQITRHFDPPTRISGTPSLRHRENAAYEFKVNENRGMARTLRWEPLNMGRDRSDQGVDVGCHEHIADALYLSAELLKLANEPREDCEHDGCLLLDGVVRDCAWKIRQVALQWRADLAALDGVEKEQLKEVKR